MFFRLPIDAEVQDKISRKQWLPIVSPRSNGSSGLVDDEFGMAGGRAEFTARVFKFHRLRSRLDLLGGRMFQALEFQPGKINRTSIRMNKLKPQGIHARH